MLSWLCKENVDRALGGYVIDMCIAIADDFLPPKKKRKKREKKESGWVTVADVFREER